ncbi:hypothetical protein SDC9_151445 [bioreactor metagenome]|uniref:Uncharacterized protein n=1 Tax=bioreactor metagenome TaxID=1076179 RepID=A0A645ESN5_9ZZZZ
MIVEEQLAPTLKIELSVTHLHPLQDVVPLLLKILLVVKTSCFHVPTFNISLAAQFCLLSLD